MVVNRPLDDQPPPEDPIDGFSLDADQRQPTITFGRVAPVRRDPHRPLRVAVREALGGPDRARQRGIRRGPAQLPLRDDHRRDPRVREVARQGRLLTLLNRREISARGGLIVSGQQTTGKTTALKQLGPTYELPLPKSCPTRCR
jgi:hypothetical protein